MKNRWILGGSVSLVLLGGGALLIPRAQSKTPEAQIAEALQSAEDAARRGSVEGILDYVSDDFKAGMLNKDRLRLLLIRVHRSGRGVKYDVRVNAPRFLPQDVAHPDQRTVVSKFAAFDLGTGENYWGTDPIMVVMKKEERRRWLLFPEPVWRVVACPALPSLPGED